MPTVLALAKSSCGHFLAICSCSGSGFPSVPSRLSHSSRTRSLVLARLSNLPSFLAWLRRGYLSSSTPRGGKFLMKLSLARARARSDESQGSQGWCSRLFVFLPRCQAAARENRQIRSHALCGQVYCLLAAAIRLHGNESLIRARGKSSLCN